METSAISLTTSQQIEDHARQQLNKHRLLKETEQYCQDNTEPEKPDSLSSLILFIIRKKNLQILIPDYELYICRQLFTSNVCHESYFGLARLLSFEGNFHHAIDMLNSAILIKHDPVYLTWLYTLTVKVRNQTEASTKASSSNFKNFFCCNVYRTETIIIEKLESLPDTVEKY